MLCRSHVAEEALERIKKEGKYDLRLLPATDVDGVPITPTQYEEKLSGVTILLLFFASCNIIASKAQFYTDMKSISVLQEPASSHSPTNWYEVTIEKNLRRPRHCEAVKKDKRVTEYIVIVYLE
ncbi:hypothetical protein BJV78DRAFT_1177650 [Lactifluus subvellereus]|nr:hypothetical protein BJV78DRAFT_1177650 [Lactifluus subvellereus]